MNATKCGLFGFLYVSLFVFFFFKLALPVVKEQILKGGQIFWKKISRMVKKLNADVKSEVTALLQSQVSASSPNFPRKSVF